MAWGGHGRTAVVSADLASGQLRSNPKIRFAVGRGLSCRLAGRPIRHADGEGVPRLGYDPPSKFIGQRNETWPAAGMHRAKNVRLGTKLNSYALSEARWSTVRSAIDEVKIIALAVVEVAHQVERQTR